MAGSREAVPCGAAGMLDFLYGLQRLRGVRFGLANIRAVLRRMGDPQWSFRSVHVAGTKGKGSTAALLHSILVEAGRSAALYTSPHLNEFGERFRIGRELAGGAEIHEAFREVGGACRWGEDPPLTFFEWCTAMAFLMFARRGVGVAVLEAGMGGRLDATRAAGGDLALISRVGLDHQEYLGDTVEAIAGEKAAIAGRGSLVIAAPQPRPALAEIRKRAAAAGARLIELGRAARIGIHGTGLDGVCFDLELPGMRLPRLWCSLPGRHQAVNASLAALGALSLEGGGPVGEGAVRRGLALCNWPGRLEPFGEDPVVVLDGAHNVDSALALADFLGEVFPGGGIHMVLGILADKDVPGILAALAPLSPTLHLAPCRSPRTAAPEMLAGAARKAGLAVAGTYASIASALAAARRGALSGRTVVVAGSLFAVAEARASLLGLPTEPVARLQ